MSRSVVRRQYCRSRSAATVACSAGPHRGRSHTMPIPDEYLTPIGDPDVDSASTNDPKVSSDEPGDEAEASLDAVNSDEDIADELELESAEEEVVEDAGTGGFGYGDPAD